MVENIISVTNDLKNGYSGKVKFVFEDTDSHASFKNITQSYCLCFNEQGEILLGYRSWSSDYPYLLPGGTIEKGETPEEALHRELIEEVDVTVTDLYLLGGQRCYFLEDKSKPSISQLRFVAMLDELRPLTPDPDNGYLWGRIFVKPEELNSYLKWGPVGDHLAKLAKEWFKQHNL